jgi:hypothetical protein
MNPTVRTKKKMVSSCLVERVIDLSFGKTENARGAKEDLDYMKKTMISENRKVDEGYFDFHQTVHQIIEEQDTLFQAHISAIKEDAMLLSKESELVSNVQGIGFSDFDLDSYVQKMDEVVQKKLKLYQNLNKKLARFK